MVTISLPETRYARFTHRGKVGQVDLTVSYIYSSWLLRSGMRHTYGADLEFYGPRYHPESDQSEIDYAIPIAENSPRTR
jgi:AraC family transcriptional regulator